MSLSAVVSRLRAAGCVFAEDEARLLAGAAATPEALARLVERRAAGEPLEHVLGWARFGGLRVRVDPGVFVPRPRTEFLAEQAIAAAPAGVPVVVDLCCGSGALGAVVAAALGEVELHAADIDPAAVACARRNLPGARVHEGDLYDPLPDDLRGRVDLLLANVPYVPTDEIPLLPAEARLHEARVALDGGGDGLEVLRRVAAGAGQWLAPGGRLLFETGERQAAHAVAAIARHGLRARVVRSAGWDATVIIAVRAG
ncbi:MAG TPA: putative protein N(5)-glutamine methyltransferase [Nonomuraea sp.]|uniref:putative protein N(5)-glutamine methyltransferase n=1 Tax=Nonomuraea sp. NPDC049649 TaxID=3155776 RepID=UPI002CE09085|nr:putative protein N(5)-glutamine methyltransferase [Nonomuraea sp.]